MTGVDSYSVTPLTNETIDGTTTWREGQFPSTVNNGVRQILSDLRDRWNDLPWFQYGNGDQDTSTHLAKPCVYVSATSFSVTGNGNQTGAYHGGRPVRAVGSTTGTIYGAIASSSYNGGTETTTVSVTWTAGSLSDEALVISIGLPVLGQPVPGAGVSGVISAEVVRITELVVTDPVTGTVATGDGLAYTRIVATMNGCSLTAVSASLTTASNSGALTIQVRRYRSAASVDMLSTAITIDVNELDSSGATAPVIDTANDDIATGDYVFVDVDGAGTGAIGLNVQLTFTPAA